MDSHAGSCFGGLAQLGVTLVDSHNWESLWWTDTTGSRFGGNHSSGVSQQQQKYEHCYNYNFVVIILLLLSI